MAIYIIAWPAFHSAARDRWEDCVARLLLVDSDHGSRTQFLDILGRAGHQAVGESSGPRALEYLRDNEIDLVLLDLDLPDASGLECLRQTRILRAAVPIILLASNPSTREVVTAMRFGAADVLRRPLPQNDLISSIRTVLVAERGYPLSAALISPAVDYSAHAAARWARALVPIVDAPSDPRTVAGWGRLVFISEGALRNWCSTAGMSPRHSLVFARMMRAAHLGHGRTDPANLLDVADKRTLGKLLKLAGLDASAPYPADVTQFIERQSLVRDSMVLAELYRALGHRRVLAQVNDECVA